MFSCDLQKILVCGVFNQTKNETHLEMPSKTKQPIDDNSENTKCFT